MSDLVRGVIMKCRVCGGCGKLADTEDREPWSAWTTLPLESSVVVKMGMVKPVQCDACLGRGETIVPCDVAGLKRLAASLR